MTSQISEWWAAVAAAPVAIAAFWGASTENKNDLETLMSDYEKSM
jgi:hypothetical protein